VNGQTTYNSLTVRPTFCGASRGKNSSAVYGYQAPVKTSKIR